MLGFVRLINYHMIDESSGKSIYALMEGYVEPTGVVGFGRQIGYSGISNKFGHYIGYFSFMQ
jgi:hypothetical protein